MKKFTLITFLLLSIFSFRSRAQEADPNNGLKHIMTATEAAHRDRIALGFVETDPPVGAIRNVEEFGLNDGALIRYPFGIPMTIIKEMAKDAKVVTIVANSSQQTTVTTQYQSNGVNLANCSFLIAPSDSYWTRDYGPWYVTFGNNQTGIVDFPYNRPRPNDDEIPKKVATMQGIPWFGMNVIHTGGNYMTNGIDQASSTELVWEENPSQTHEQIAQKFHDYLGIENYMVAVDPNGTYIDHIDCWSKFLGPDKVLVRKVPASHPQYDEIEAAAAYFASQVSSYGWPYRVFRVYTPNDEPYTNSFILKNKVFVPTMGTTNDAGAILAYQQAMPGYQISGFLGSPSTPWESTDALHCRTHEMADFGMLLISHTPLHDSIAAQPSFQVNADITAFSGELVYPDSVWIIYKVNNGTWDTLTMTNTLDNHWTASIPGQMEGSVISYYIHAEDASNRSTNHPYIGAPDAHKFVIKVSAIPDVVVSPDSLIFLTLQEMQEGKTAIARNYSSQPVTINYIDHQQYSPFWWFVDPWNINLPYTMQSGDTLDLTVKLGPGVKAVDLLCDTLFINTAPSSHQVMVCVDPMLISEVASRERLGEVKVYPNPMGNSTTFSYFVEKESAVSIEVYSLQGKLVSIPLKQRQSAGNHTFSWEGIGIDGTKLTPGLYLYRVALGDMVVTGKISIVE